MLIEHFLIDALGRKVMAYTLQDLQCEKCLEVCISIYFGKQSLTKLVFSDKNGKS